MSFYDADKAKLFELEIQLLSNKCVHSPYFRGDDATKNLAYQIFRLLPLVGRSRFPAEWILVEPELQKSRTLVFLRRNDNKSIPQDKSHRDIATHRTRNFSTKIFGRPKV